MQTTDSLERIFHFQNKQVRTVQVNGEPWFVAKDVCEVLGIRTNSVRFILEEDEVQEFNPNDNSNDIGNEEAGHGGRDMLAVSEPDLYSLIIRSRKPEARQFRRCAGPAPICRGKNYPFRQTSCSRFPGAICSTWQSRLRMSARNCAG